MRDKPPMRLSFFRPPNGRRATRGNLPLPQRNQMAPLVGKSRTCEQSLQRKYLSSSWIGVVLGLRTISSALQSRIFERATGELLLNLGAAAAAFVAASA